MCLDPTLNTHLHCANSWVESHQPGCNSGDNSGSDPNQTKNVGTRPALAQTEISLVKPKYEIQRLMVLYSQVYFL